MLNIDQIAAHIVLVRALETFDTGSMDDYGIKSIAEAEIKTHLVVPFLRALGWPNEQIAVEWSNWPRAQGRIDIGVFNSAHRVPKKCRYLIEVKKRKSTPRLSDSHAITQAMQYAEIFPKRIPFVVTNGIRYRMYEYDDQKQDYARRASANLSGPSGQSNSAEEMTELDEPRVTLDLLHRAQLPPERSKLGKQDMEVFRLFERMSPE